MFSCYKPMWLYPKEIQLRRNKEYNELSGPIIHLDKGDPYITASYNKTFDLGKDLLDNGTYWPYFIHDRPEGYFIREGNHRMAAIHILIEKGLWPEDKKVFCLVYSKNVYDPLYYLEEPVYLMKIKLNNEGNPLQDLVQQKCERACDVMACFNFSTPYLRNWIWDMEEKIQPHILLNMDNNWWQIKDEYEANER